VALSGLPSGEEKRAVVRAMFDRIAPRYDRMNRLMTAGLDQRWRRLALDCVGVGPGDRLIDLACGTGDLCELARARGARPIGVDFAREMLRCARRRGAGAELVQADGAALPFPAACANALTCGFALRNFASLPPIFAEAARVLEPGGRVALLEVDRPANPVLRAGHALYFERVVPLLGALLADRAAYAYLPRSAAYLPSPPELRALLEKAGFEQVRRRALLFGAVQLVTAVRRGAA
jgi:demethylmenaquinone methyltransferase/2-methoxy-6-polyprenyl-1,4-benzoquinol methylase